MQATRANDWQNIRELLNEALLLDKSNRRQFIAAIEDTRIRSEVESLLNAAESGDSLRLEDIVNQAAHIVSRITGPRPGSSQVWNPDSSSSEAVERGSHIGLFHLLQLVGLGGMGEVWLAQQTEPIRRRVALKLVRTDLHVREVIKRFHSERQALALMNHPAIAKIFDAGCTSHGRPYFAMEYVPGLPLTSFCDKHRLSTRERLKLFIDVCEGVQHAHQKAIIHRDLKPSNILVSEVEGKYSPKIIDFGVAKAISQPLSATTMFTRLGSVIGTVDYMSPEQADSGVEDVDTRSDLYSLGVILYELLVGKLPLECRHLSFSEMLRKLHDETIARPSTRLRALATDSVLIATNRGSDVKSLARQLRGDLDWIALKALERERGRRYSSASEFAADIARYLRDEPVIAAPARAAYRLRKFIYRNRFVIGAAASFFILLVVFATSEAIQIRKISTERDRADKTARFMAELFRAPGPTFALGVNRTATDILSDGLKNIDSSLAKDPELQANMLEVFGKAYQTFGFHAKAISLYTRAYGLRLRTLGPEMRETLRARSLAASLEIVECRGDKRRAADAEKEMRATVDLQRRKLGEIDPDTLVSMASLAADLAQQERLAETESVLLLVVKGRHKILAPGDPSTLSSLDFLRRLFVHQHRYLEAEKITREILDESTKASGRTSVWFTRAQSALLDVLVMQGKYSESERLVREDIFSFGDYNSATELLSCLRHEGKSIEGEKFGRNVAEMAVGPSVRPIGKGSFLYNVSCLEAILGKQDQAISFLEKSIAEGAPVDASYIEHDEDFLSLRADPRFVTLVEAYRRRELKH